MNLGRLCFGCDLITEKTTEESGFRNHHNTMTNNENKNMIILIKIIKIEVLSYKNVSIVMSQNKKHEKEKKKVTSGYLVTAPHSFLFATFS